MEKRIKRNKNKVNKRGVDKENQRMFNRLKVNAVEKSVFSRKNDEFDFEFSLIKLSLNFTHLDCELMI